MAELSEEQRAALDSLGNLLPTMSEVMTKAGLNPTEQALLVTTVFSSMANQFKNRRRRRGWKKSKSS